MRIRARSLGVFALATVAGGCTEPPASPRVCGPARFYAIDRVDLPERSGEGAVYGLDLDGDGNVDNSYGTILSAAHGDNAELGLIAPIVDGRLPAGDQAWRVGVSDCDDGSTRVSLGASGGGDEVPLTLLFDPLGTFTPIAWVRVSDVVGRLTEQGGAVDGVVGFAVPMPAAEHAIVAPFAAYLTVALAAGSSSYARTIDRDRDGVVTPDELSAFDFVTTVLAPDVPDGLSFGIGVHATGVPLDPAP